MQQQSQCMVVPMQVFPGFRGDVPAEIPVERVVVDERTGAHWIVGERECANQPGARAPRYLCFDSPDTRRRVWRYPSDWRALSDSDLLDLSERRP